MKEKKSGENPHGHIFSVITEIMEETDITLDYFP